MTPEERQALKDERLKLRVECLRKESEVQELRKKNGEADLQSSQQWLLPHRKVGTQVFRSPDGDSWVCVPRTLDHGDLTSSHPYGEGSSPQEACDDFDRTWLLGDYDKDESGGLTV